MPDKVIGMTYISNSSLYLCEAATVKIGFKKSIQ